MQGKFTRTGSRADNQWQTFVREIEGLSRVRHANLVCLFGCCFEDGKQYLVYEYCSNGNLAEHLLRKYSVLTWESRVKISRDCGFAIKHLHHHVEGCIHKDIKVIHKIFRYLSTRCQVFKKMCLNCSVLQWHWFFFT